MEIGGAAQRPGAPLACANRLPVATDGLGSVLGCRRTIEVGDRGRIRGEGGKRWRLDLAKAELRKLNPAGRSALTELMHRYRNDAALPREVKPVRGEIRELRASLAHDEYRLLFAKEGKSGQVLIGLVALYKNTKRLPAADIELAERRLATWRRSGEHRR